MRLSKPARGCLHHHPVRPMARLRNAQHSMITRIWQGVRHPTRPVGPVRWLTLSPLLNPQTGQRNKHRIVASHPCMGPCRAHRRRRESWGWVRHTHRTLAVPSGRVLPLLSMPVQPLGIETRLYLLLPISVRIQCVSWFQPFAKPANRSQAWLGAGTPTGCPVGARTPGG